MWNGFFIGMGVTLTIWCLIDYTKTKNKSDLVFTLLIAITTICLIILNIIK